MKEDFKWEIVKHIATIGEPNASGWIMELNIIKWGHASPKLDLRQWNEDHTRCGKGVTFTQEQFAALREVLKHDSIESAVKENV